MVLSDNNKKELIKFAGLIIGGLAAYKVLFSKKKTTIIDIPFKIVKVISKHSKELVKEVIEPVDKVVKKVDKVTKKAIKKVDKVTKKAIKKVDKKTKKSTKKSIKDEIKLHENMAIKLYSEGKTDEAEINEKKADLIYRNNYSILFPKYHKKLIKKEDEK